MKRWKNSSFGLCADPDGEWVRYEDHCEAMKRIAGDGGQQAIYQVWDVDMLAWKDVQKDSYDERLPSNRRIVYATPAPASPAVLTDAQIVAVIATQNKSMRFQPIHTDAGRAFARAILAASPADQVDSKRLDYLDKYAVIAKPGQSVRDAIDQAMSATPPAADKE